MRCFPLIREIRVWHEIMHSGIVADKIQRKALDSKHPCWVRIIWSWEVFISTTIEWERSHDGRTCDLIRSRWLPAGGFAARPGLSSGHFPRRQGSVIGLGDLMMVALVT